MVWTSNRFLLPWHFLLPLGPYLSSQLGISTHMALGQVWESRQQRTEKRGVTWGHLSHNSQGLQGARKDRCAQAMYLEEYCWGSVSAWKLDRHSLGYRKEGSWSRCNESLGASIPLVLCPWQTKPPVGGLWGAGMKISDRFGMILGISKGLCPFLGRTLERKQVQENVMYLDQCGQSISPSIQHGGRVNVKDPAGVTQYWPAGTDEIDDGWCWRSVSAWPAIGQASALHHCHGTQALFQEMKGILNFCDVFLIPQQNEIFKKLHGVL